MATLGPGTPFRLDSTKRYLMGWSDEHGRWPKQLSTVSALHSSRSLEPRVFRLNPNVVLL